MANISCGFKNHTLDQFPVAERRDFQKAKMLAGFSKSKRRESEELESLELAMPLVPANAPIPVAAAAPAEVTAVPVSSEVSALPVDSGHPCATTISPPVVMGVPILESSDGPYCKCASAVWQDRPVAAAVPRPPALACARSLAVFLSLTGCCLRGVRRRCLAVLWCSVVFVLCGVVV